MYGCFVRTTYDIRAYSSPDAGWSQGIHSHSIRFVIGKSVRAASNVTLSPRISLEYAAEPRIYVIMETINLSGDSPHYAVIGSIIFWNWQYHNTHLHSQENVRKIL
jgi:hypothetical protein